MWTSRAPLAALAVVLALAGSSCSWAAGEAQAERFEEWYAAHPVDDVQLEEVTGEDVVPVIGGATEVRARLTAAGPDVPDLTRAMRDLCRFQEVADSGAPVTYVLLVGAAEVEFPCRARGDLQVAQLWERLPSGDDVEKVAVGREQATLETVDARAVRDTRTLVAALTAADRWPDLGVQVTADRVLLQLDSPEEARVLPVVGHALGLPARDRVVGVRADNGQATVTSDLGPEQLRRLARRLQDHARAEVGGFVEVVPGKVTTLPGYETAGLRPAVRRLAEELSERALVTRVRLGPDRVELVTATVPDARSVVAELVEDPRAREVGALGIEVDGLDPETGRRACRTDLEPSDPAAAYLLLDLCAVPDVVEAEDGPVLEVGHDGTDLTTLVTRLRQLPAGRSVTLTTYDDTADRRSTVRFTVGDQPRFEAATGDEALAEAMAAAWD